VTGLGLLAHCGAKWWACDGGSAVGFLVFVGWCVIGLRRLERRTEARAAAHREAQRLRSELSAAMSSLDDPGAPAEPHASDRTD
jgi:hypothetical protein